MAKDAISYDDYLKLKGLFTLAADHNRALRDIGRAAAMITGELDESETPDYEYYGHTSDEIIKNQPDADDLLRRLKVRVEPAEAVTT